MFLITGGIGLLGCIIGIILLIISYVKNKGFILALIVFLLCFVIMGGSIVLQARGGLDLFNKDFPEDVQQGDAAGAPDGDSDTPPQAEPARVSLDELCSLVDVALTGNFTGKSVTHDETTLTISVWRDGLTVDTADNGTWENEKTAMTELAGSLRALIDACGPENTALSLHLMDAQNQETALLSLSETNVTYDITAETRMSSAAPDGGTDGA